MLSFYLYPLGTAIILSLIAGLLSPVVVSKHYAFLGEAISHSTLLGLIIASYCSTKFQFSSELANFFITLLITTLSTFFLARAERVQRNHDFSDGHIGIFLTATLTLSFILYQFLNLKQDLFSLLFGDITLSGKTDFYLALFLLFIVFAVFILFFARWIIYLCDENDSALSKKESSFLHYLLFFLLSISIVSFVRLCGPFLVNAFLIIPGTYALKKAKGIKNLFIRSVLFSFFATLCGLIFSLYFDFSVGLSIASCQLIFYIFLCMV